MANTGRPKKVRYVQKMPKIVQFSPRGKPGRPDEIELTICEFESIKLADYQGFSQAQGAVAMRLSRASFGRIVRKAREKVAGALVNGKVIKIRMGDTQIGVRKKDFTRDNVIGKEIDKFRIRTENVVEVAEKFDKNNKKEASRGSSGDFQRSKSGIVSLK